MTHASLCKKTYEIIRWFLRLKARETLAMGVAAGISLLFVAAGSLLGQSNPPPLTITTTSLPNGILELPYLTSQQGTVQVNVTGGVPPYFWFIGSDSNTSSVLPPGLQLNGSTGAITGTPTALGNTLFNVSVSDSSDSDSGFTYRDLQISVVPCTPTFSPSSASPLPPGDVNTSYPQVNFTESGCPGFTYTYTEQAVDPFNPNNLPPGLKLSTSGTLSENPAARELSAFCSRPPTKTKT